jgi:hypothetical protein
MKKTLTLLFTVGVTAASCYAQKAPIRLNLQKDSTYYLNQNSTLTITQDIPGHQQVITIFISGLMSHKVTAIEDTVYEMAVQYENLDIKMDMSGTTLMNVDTKKAGQDPISKIMASLLHKPITVSISKTGKVLEVKNIDNLYAHMFDEFPQITEMQKAQFKAQVQQSFGEKALKNNFQDAFAVLPGTDVGVNDSWVSDTKLETVSQANIKTTYVLISITDNEYVIHGDAVVSPAGANADFVITNGMPMRYNNASGSYTADIKLDKKTGWITGSKTEKNIKGDMEIKDNPQLPGGMTFPMTITGNINMSNK